MNDDVILELKNLKQYFVISKRLTVRAVDDVSFKIHKGEIFGLVGESGSGKSTVARSVMGLYPLTGGEVWHKGHKISDPKVHREYQKDIQRNMQIIFQDSAAALNHRMTVRKIIAEPMQASRLYASKKALDQRIDELLEQVGLDLNIRTKYPGEISGGQRQRVAIARSISTNPDIIIADEPISSLDVSIQAQIITLFQKLQKEYGFAFLFIAHDLSVVRFICDHVAVMLHGKLLELAETEKLFENPLHPYTKSLISAMPVADPVYERNKKMIDYDPETFSENGLLREEEPDHWVYEEG